MKIVIVGATGTISSTESIENFYKQVGFPEHVPVTMSRVAQAYIKSMLGGQTGKIYKVS